MCSVTTKYGNKHAPASVTKFRSITKSINIVINPNLSGLDFPHIELCIPQTRYQMR